MGGYYVVHSEKYRSSATLNEEAAARNRHENSASKHHNDSAFATENCEQTYWSLSDALTNFRHVAKKAYGEKIFENVVKTPTQFAVNNTARQPSPTQPAEDEASFERFIA